MLNPLDTADRFTRRDFLKGASALAIASATFRARAQSPSFSTRAYVGSYTGKAGNGEGIYLFNYEAASGMLLDKQLVAKTPSPSWIVVHPSRRFLYAVNEVADFHGNSGSVSAFSIDASTGALTLLNTVSSEGAEPAHISLDATGKFALVANYGGGSTAVFPIQATGALGSAVDVRRHEGSLGAAKASSAPNGSFAISGHDAPHAHMIAVSPDNRFVITTDLGQDRIYIYAFDAGTGKLSEPGGTPFSDLPSGDGPRHFAFHPNGNWLYSLQEESSTVVFFHWDAATGALHAEQVARSTPPGFAGTSFASEILIAPDGKTLYAANRLHDTIAVFSIDDSGHLAWQSETPTGGDYPVQCRIDPAGRFFFACNRRSDVLTSFLIDPATGALRPTGQYTPVGSASSITFVENG